MAASYHWNICVVLVEKLDFMFVVESKGAKRLSSGHASGFRTCVNTGTEGTKVQLPTIYNE